MATFRTLIVSALLLTAAVDATHAATPELNSRQGIDNASRNRIASVRLQALLVEQSTEGMVSNAQQRSQGCNTEIGNSDNGGSLLDRDRSVIVVGDIINVCR